jgi:hypothetical protein
VPLYVIALTFVLLFIFSLITRQEVLPAPDGSPPEPPTELPSGEKEVHP